jgi:hypothetical protein
VALAPAAGLPSGHGHRNSGLRIQGARRLGPVVSATVPPRQTGTAGLIIVFPPPEGLEQPMGGNRWGTSQSPPVERCGIDGHRSAVEVEPFVRDGESLELSGKLAWNTKSSGGQRSHGSHTRRPLRGLAGERVDPLGRGLQP